MKSRENGKVCKSVVVRRYEKGQNVWLCRNTSKQGSIWFTRKLEASEVVVGSACVVDDVTVWEFYRRRNSGLSTLVAWLVHYACDVNSAPLLNLFGDHRRPQSVSGHQYCSLAAPSWLDRLCGVCYVHRENHAQSAFCNVALYNWNNLRVSGLWKSCNDGFLLLSIEFSQTRYDDLYFHTIFSDLDQT